METVTRNYRPEIDGLRAIAVLAIIIFHVDSNWLPGGFAGVDVFFVISGFLITSNIQNQLNRGEFSFSNFYWRRFKRLAPALFVTVFVTLCVSIFLFSSEHLLLVGKSAIASLLSLSNIYFWSESGYFDLDGQLKPLLHTWSLSVEEQFYFLWPALLMVLAKLGRVSLSVAGLLGVGLFSLIVGQWLVSQGWSSVSFYWMPFRVFEFVAGALAAYFPAKFLGVAWRATLSLLGGVAIFLSFFLYSDQTPFPGFSALLPALGTLLLLLGGSVVSTRWLLENPAAVFIGKISYSAYLAHWPLIVYALYLSRGDLVLLDKLGLVAASLLLGAFSWKFVEQPYRFGGGGLGFYKLVPAMSTLASIVLCLCMLIWITGGNVLGRYEALSAKQVQEGKSSRFELVSKGCSLLSLDNESRCDQNADTQILVLGNSHEPDGYNIWASAYGGQKGQNIISFGTVNGCLEFLGNMNSRVLDARNCKPRLKRLADKDFVESLDVIVLSFNMPFARSKAKAYSVVASMISMNPDIQVVLLGGYLNLKNDCTYYIQRNESIQACGRKEYITYGPAIEQRHLQEGNLSELLALTEVIYINKFDLLCGAPDDCSVFANGEPFTYDKHHLSLGFAQHAGDRLRYRYSNIDDLLSSGDRL